MLVPVAILAIKPLRDRNIPYAIAFLAVIALLLTLGLGLHDAYSAVTDVTRGKAQTPDLGTAVDLLRATAWAAFVGAIGVLWMFVQHVYPRRDAGAH